MAAAARASAVLGCFAWEIRLKIRVCHTQHSRAENFAPQKKATWNIFIFGQKPTRQLSSYISLYQYHKTTEKGYRAKTNGEINVTNKPQNTAANALHSIPQSKTAATPPPPSQTTKLTRLEKLGKALHSAAAQTEHWHHQHNVHGQVPAQERRLTHKSGIVVRVGGVHRGCQRNSCRAGGNHWSGENEHGEEGQPAAGKEPKGSAGQRVIVPKVVPEQAKEVFATIAAAA